MGINQGFFHALSSIEYAPRKETCGTRCFMRFDMDTLKSKKKSKNDAHVS
jgi:hypothetical protein